MKNYKIKKIDDTHFIEYYNGIEIHHEVDKNKNKPTMKKVIYADGTTGIFLDNCKKIELRDSFGNYLGKYALTLRTNNKKAKMLDQLKFVKRKVDNRYQKKKKELIVSNSNYELIPVATKKMPLNNDKENIKKINELLEKISMTVVSNNNIKNLQDLEEALFTVLRSIKEYDLDKVLNNAYTAYENILLLEQKQMDEKLLLNIKNELPAVTLNNIEYLESSINYIKNIAKNKNIKNKRLQKQITSYLKQSEQMLNALKEGRLIKEEQLVNNNVLKDNIVASLNNNKKEKKLNNWFQKQKNKCQETFKNWRLMKADYLSINYWRQARNLTNNKEFSDITGKEVWNLNKMTKKVVNNMSDLPQTQTYMPGNLTYNTANEVKDSLDDLIFANDKKVFNNNSYLNHLKNNLSEEEYNEKKLQAEKMFNDLALYDGTMTLLSKDVLQRMEQHYKEYKNAMKKIKTIGLLGFLTATIAIGGKTLKKDELEPSKTSEEILYDAPSEDEQIFEGNFTKIDDEKEKTKEETIILNDVKPSEDVTLNEETTILDDVKPSEDVILDEETIIKDSNDFTNPNEYTTTTIKKEQLNQYKEILNELKVYINEEIKIKDDALIYSDIISVANKENGKHSLYGSDITRTVESIVLSNGSDIVNVKTDEEAKEYINRGYKEVGVSVLNQYSNSNKTIEGRYEIDDVVTFSLKK